MLKKVVCLMALLVLVAALMPSVQSAPPQNYKGTPHPTVREYGPFAPDFGIKHAIPGSQPPSGMCGNPTAKCLFYGGDFLFDPLSDPSLPNGLANETTNIISGTPYGAAVWVPFTIPKGRSWSVTGLFTNNFATYGVLDQAPTQPLSAALWSINQGIVPGSAGTVIASGTSAATSTPTGRGAFNLQEFTVEVTGLSITLTPGSYWMAVVPLCTNTADPFCFGVFFQTDVEYVNTLPKNTVGPAEPIDSAFFDSPFFFFSFTPTNGPVGACLGFGCDAFSAGVLGHPL